MSLCYFSHAAPVTLTDEAALLSLWHLHKSAGTRHESIIALCKKMQRDSPANPLHVVTKEIAGWHLLQMGKVDEATSALNAMLSYTHEPIAVVGGEMARRWLTRIDREKVKDALAIMYKKNISYPKSLRILKTLPKESVPPLTDRWGKQWDYKLAGFKLIKGLEDQRYSLTSAKLGKLSDFNIALKQPYASSIKLKAIASVAIGAQQHIKFQTTTEKPETFVLSEGAAFEGVTFVYMGKKILILSDGDYWLILPKPLN